MKSDFIDVEILPDGTIKVQTDAISAANHVGADKLLALVRELTGGETTTKSRKSHTHSHAHGHTHEHN